MLFFCSSLHAPAYIFCAIFQINVANKLPTRFNSPKNFIDDRVRVMSIIYYSINN